MPRLTPDELKAASRDSDDYQQQVLDKVRLTLLDVLELECRSYKVDLRAIGPVAVAELLGHMLASLDFATHSTLRGDAVVGYAITIRENSLKHIEHDPIANHLRDALKEGRSHG